MIPWVKIVPNAILVPNTFHPLGCQFYHFLLRIASSFSALTTLLSHYPIILWLDSSIIVLLFVSVTLGLACWYRALEAHLDSNWRYIAVVIDGDEPKHNAKVCITCIPSTRARSSTLD